MFLVALHASAAEPLSGESPADHLPPHIVHLTSFGERADWSHDGKRILFLSKTFGDAMEIDLATKAIRNLTARYPHHGYTRALYLANGDILLSGPESFDPKHAGEARTNCFLYVLDKSLAKPAVPLGVRCIEGPAVSRKRLHIAWTDWPDQASFDKPPEVTRLEEADIVYENGTPKLANRRTMFDNSDFSFPCTLETQNFRPPDEQELIFSAYRPNDGCDVCGVDLATKKFTNYTESPEQYDEPEGIFPDGEFTLVECDRQNDEGPNHVDVWKLALNSQRQRPVRAADPFQRLSGLQRLEPGGQRRRPIIAFQMARSVDAAGVGHGLFIYDVEKAGGGER